MALSPSFTVCIIDQQPGTFGTTMNAIRAWLDHTKIQPQLFQAAASGVGFEITFVHEDEVHLFVREFQALNPIRQP